MDPIPILWQLGLSKQEAAVYLAALKLGLSKASDIAHKATIKREAAYYILGTLQEKGFVSEVIKSGIKHYSALSPQLLPDLISEQTLRKINLVKEALPELETLSKTTLSRPKIEYYEGIDSYQAVASKFFDKPNQHIVGYVPESLPKFFLTFSSKFQEVRQKKKITLHIITPKTPFFENFRSKDKQSLRTIRFNDTIMKGLDVGYYITPEGIALVKANEKERNSIFIEDREIAELHRRIFEEVWKEST